MYTNIFSKPIIPSIEIGSYEALWMENDASFNKMADKFRAVDSINILPSDYVQNKSISSELYNRVLEKIRVAGIRDFGVRFRNTLDYPSKLNDAKSPLQLIYYAGDWTLTTKRSIAIVGTRHPTQNGLLRATKLAKEFVKQGFVIASGLATGIDTRVHTTAIEEGGKTIAVLGTPLNVIYPRENTDLFNRILKNHLIISQIPFIKYEHQSYNTKRFYFPERNKTMSAISEATVIVEAGETSGTLIQARAAIEQGRKLFILASCFEQGLTWPEKYLLKGAIKVNTFDDIWQHLSITTETIIDNTSFISSLE